MNVGLAVRDPKQNTHDTDWKVPGVIREKLGLATIRWGHAVAVG